MQFLDDVTFRGAIEILVGSRPVKPANFGNSPAGVGTGIRMMNASANVRPHASGGRRSRHSAHPSNVISPAEAFRHRRPM